MTAAPLEPKCLILDLEVIPGTESTPDRMIKIGAMRPDTQQQLEFNTNARNLRSVLHQVDELASGASFLLGHNLLAHDLPILRQQAPTLTLLELPAIDTLRLSPLAFPQNPYHRLIKNYKLIRDSINSPLADCRATLTLFQDQYVSFEQLMAKNPDEFRTYHALIAPQPGAGLGNFMLALSRQASPSMQELCTIIPALMKEGDPTHDRDIKVCKLRLQQLLTEDVVNPSLHWPIAYTLAWLRVSGGNSVLAPWVRHQFPAVQRLIRELRDQACGSPACGYCRSTHDPQRELKRYFGFDHFRPEPPNQHGGSLQQDIVRSGMRGAHVLAVLPTGGGKSLCYQLPALNRYHRNGGLTLILSPLQSLMKDQVDGLLGHNVQSAATLNGLLTLPERAETLEKIQLGDVGILLVSPEQFRNKAFRKAIEHRQINAWIFDEAHCLSKWGNDFRPDYLYVARFIREFTGSDGLAPISCFTATAKLEVLADIRQHFKNELDVEFEAFIGSHERNNLDFEVLPTSSGEKWLRTHTLLQHDLDTQTGGAVVFVASRKSAEELAEFLKRQNWACAHFHAGLPPQSKKDIQEAFIKGGHNGLRVIVATNAFGMGVDKPDIRLVIHAEIPGSLENYLQEAGRAGRDQAQARCVLLYDPNDIETQFSLAERSKISKIDIEQILKKLRQVAKRRNDGQVIITAGEILNDEYVHTSFEADDRDADTKVMTAIAWLERTRFLERNENNTQVFPAKLKFRSMDEAIVILEKARLSERRLQEFKSILGILHEVDADERVTTDQLIIHTGLTQDEVTAILRQLESLGLLENDTQITLYVHVGIANASTQRLEFSLQLEKALFEVLREAGDTADHGDWQDLNLPQLTTRLREMTQAEVLPLQVNRLLRALSQDSDGTSSSRSQLELRQLSRDSLKLRTKQTSTWLNIEETARKRRSLGQKLLEFLLAKLPGGKRGKDLLVETTLGELAHLIESDLDLSTMTRPEHRNQWIQQVLLYLHHEEVLVLNHGMTVMRRAMTIQIKDEPSRRYQKDDYHPLTEHYNEKRIQVHVMREYAEVALREMTAALRLVMHYFTLPKRDFLKRYFADKNEVLELATSETSWRRIVDPLDQVQRQIVIDDQDQNRLVLAGPGSGKTRVIVHRVACLLRVRRIPAASIIVLTFNRHAANEVKKRLHELVGNDAFGLTVLTYHAMAMRLMGVSFSGRADVPEHEINQVVQQAVEMLEGKRNAIGEDDLRDRLMQGYRYILVDEYQDIDDWQYRLVSALAGRCSEQEGKLTLLAVGDDDQNVYSWRHTSNRYLEQFQQDYQAELSYLVENYRSTKNIIAAANTVIGANQERLKNQHPIRIKEQRQDELPGGRWQKLDEQHCGQVLRLQISGNDRTEGNIQCQAGMEELSRLLHLDSHGSWRDCAILARNHDYLLPFQSWCEQRSIPYSLAANKDQELPLTRQRDFVIAVDALSLCGRGDLTVKEASQLLHEHCAEPEWRDYFSLRGEYLTAEFGDCLVPVRMLIDWIYDDARETRRLRQKGLYLGTVHSAKGLEFKHVVLLDGGWKATEEERRLFYVGMTRAKETLTICEFSNQPHVFATLLDQKHIRLEETRIPRDPTLSRRYRQLALSDLYLGFAGGFQEGSPIHNAQKQLRCGDELQMKTRMDGTYDFSNASGQVVCRSSRSFVPDMLIDKVEVAGFQMRWQSDEGKAFQERCKVQQWTIVVPRIIGKNGEGLDD